VDEDLLGGFRLGAFAGPFDEFAVDWTIGASGQLGRLREELGLRVQVSWMIPELGYCHRLAWRAR
jgi:hypothetical protein